MTTKTRLSALKRRTPPAPRPMAYYMGETIPEDAAPHFLVPRQAKSAEEWAQMCKQGWGQRMSTSQKRAGQQRELRGPWVEALATPQTSV